MVRPVEIKALDDYKIWIRFSDQSDGVVNLSHLIHRGAFRKLINRGYFESVRISESGSIAWGDELELCPDALYLRVTGKKIEDVMPGMKL